MNAEQILRELNSSPYSYFYYAKEKVVFPLGDGKTEFQVKRNRKTDALEVFSESKKFSFEWDKRLKRWINA